MPQILPIDTHQPGPAARVIDTVKAGMGSVPNIFATMAHSPAVLDGLLSFNSALGKGVLKASLREQIALTVAGENACDYCASAHTLLAKGTGVPEDETARNLRGESSDPKTAAVLRFTRDVVRTRGLVGTSSLTELRNASVSEAEIVEILANIGINLFTNYFNHVARTEIDFPLVNAVPQDSVAA